MKYGSSELQGKFVLAPMAGYTDMAFRLLCRRRGAAMCFTEFANAEAIVRGGKNTDALLRTCKDEMPAGVQIFGESAQGMAKAARTISRRVECGELFASCIDINFGCPSGSVVRAGAGSALLKNPEKMAAIVSACASASSLPVTAKIRSGWANDSAAGLAKTIERAGAAGITVHWRTATEGRKRGMGWEGLRRVKEAAGIPIIANGGAATPGLAVRMLRESGCDAVMIASGALGNPGIFARANALLEGRECAPVDWGEKLALFGEYRRIAEEFGILSEKRLKLHAIEFLSGFRGAKAARKKLNAAKTAGEITAIMGEFSPGEEERF